MEDNVDAIGQDIFCGARRRRKSNKSYRLQSSGGYISAQADTKPPRSLIHIISVSIDFDHPLEEMKHATIVNLGV